MHWVVAGSSRTCPLLPLAFGFPRRRLSSAYTTTPLLSHIGRTAGGDDPRDGERNRPASNETHRQYNRSRCPALSQGTGHGGKLCFIGHGLMENRSGPDCRCPADPGLGLDTTRHPGYGKSQRVRKPIEEAFGRIKTSPTCARPPARNMRRVIVDPLDLAVRRQRRRAHPGDRA